MRKKICGDCGHIFSENEATTTSVLVGEFWGAPAYATVNTCPERASLDITDYYGGDDDDEQ